jgi:hypothetical protein
MSCMTTTSSSCTPERHAPGRLGLRTAAALLLCSALLPAIAASAGGADRPQGSQAPYPSVGSCRPAQGPPGTRVTIRGSNFRQGATVELGGVPADEVEVLSAREISARAGPHAPGRVTVTVTNPDGLSGTRGWTFRYLPP